MTGESCAICVLFSSAALSGRWRYYLLLFIGHTFAELSVHNTSEFVSLCFMYTLGQVEYVRL